MHGRRRGTFLPASAIFTISPSPRQQEGWQQLGHLEPSFSLYGDQGRGQLELILWLFAFFWDKGHFVVKQAGLSLGTEDGL